MKRILAAGSILLLQTLNTGCQKPHAGTTASEIDTIPLIKEVLPTISETSGIADSKKNKGYLWVQEDSDNPTQLYLLRHDGTVAKTIPLENVFNRDWEEIQLAGGNIYLADIGDKQVNNSEYIIYIFTEPAFDVNSIAAIKTLKFIYEDGPHNAEAFLVDEITKDIFIITKNDAPSRIYKLTYPYNTNSVNIASAVGTLKYSGVVGAAISPDGKELIIKTYIELLHYTRTDGQSLSQTLQNMAKKLPYRIEPQGEAVCFATDQSGYFTLSEKSLFGTVNLYFYKWK